MSASGSSVLADLTPEQRELLVRRLSRKRRAAGRDAAGDRLESLKRKSGRFPLSPAQDRLWALDRLEPGSSAYNLASAFRLDGELALPALYRAIAAVVVRHGSLRTRFEERDGEPAQAVVARLRVPLPVVDLTRLPEPERGSAARGLATAEANRAFDLERLPLLRSTVLRFADREHALLFTVHHIVSDGWSMGILMREVTGAYRAAVAGERAVPPPLPVQYSDFAVWQRRRLEDGGLDRQLDYWRRRLDGLPTLLDLPLDRPRPAQRRGAGRSRPLFVAWSETDPRPLAREAGVSLFTLLLAVFQVLLHRLSGQDDVAAGTPVAGRSRSELEGVIGFFVNTLVLRSDLSGRPSVRELLARTGDTVLDAQAHQDLPFARLVEELRPERSLSHSPLFQAMFVFQNTPGGGEPVRGLRVSPLDFRVETTRFDLMLQLAETPHGLTGFVQHATDILDGPTAQRWIGHFERLLAAACREPDRPIGELPLLGAAERHQLLREWNDAEAEVEARTLGRLARHAERAPDRVAAVAGGRHASYGFLHRESGRFAAALAGRGIGREAVVAVLCHRGVDLLTGLLGILRAGAIYLPLGPAHPAARLASVLERSSPAAVLVTDDGADAALAEALEAIPIHRRPERMVLAELFAAVGDRRSAQPAGGAEDGLAYVIYTSGSTGVPKGAMVEHRGMENHLAAKVHDLRLGNGDTVAQTASQTFDISIWQLLAPLVCGGRMEIVGDEIAHEPAALAATLAARRVTIFEAVPSLLHFLVDELEGEAPEASALRWVIPTGEALSPELRNRWLVVRPDVPLLNAYGPTECSDDVSHHRIRGSAGEPGGPVAIGRPVVNLRLAVTDRRLEAIPIGVPGELVVGGAGVGRGYLGDPRRTAEAFVPDALSEAEGARLYRTGDLVRSLPDGILQFLGRLDHQVKVRGFRIELGEIETALLALPEIAEAVVVARDDGAGGSYLAAYTVANAGAEPDPERMRRALARRLPEYMIPGAFVALDEMPLTAHGKIDRARLPEPEQGAAPRAPHGPVEEVLAGLWAEVLGRDVADAGADFFALGGHSLTATRVAARVKRAFGVDLPLRTLFESPTLEGLAARVEEALRDGGAGALPPLDAGPLDRSHPLSFAQERLWLVYRLQPESPAYNIPLAYRLSGPLHLRALHASLAAVERRHAVLRTRFVETEDAVVQVVDPPSPSPMPVIDLSRLGAGSGGRALPEARRLAAAEGLRPFDLERDRVTRAAVVRLGPGDHAALFTMHHIASDGWSLGLLVRELASLYPAFRQAGPDGGPAPEGLPDLPIQYADYARWQRSWLRDELLAEHLEFWRERIAGLPPVLDLPTDRPRPRIQGHRGGTESFWIPDELVGRVGALARDRGATPFMVLLGAFQALLRHVTGQDEFAVGIPVAGRDRVETENLIGFFVNSLVARAEVGDEASFELLIDRVRDDALAGHLHQELPFEKLVEELASERRLDRHPIFQVAFVVQNAAVGTLDLPGVEARSLGVERKTTKLDLSLSVSEARGGSIGSLEYSTDLFDVTTVKRLGRRYRFLLEAALDAPSVPVSKLPVHSPAERHQVLREWDRAPADPPPSRPLHRVFEDRARRRPDAIAVVTETGSWTYGELERWSARLAQRIRAAGSETEARVGICLGRGPAAMAAVLGTLRARCSWVYLDPSYPAERVARMVEDAEVELVLTRPGTAAALPDGVRTLDVGDGRDASAVPGDLPADDPHPLEIAYVIFTSGSTGVPKGVAVEHRGLSRLAPLLADTSRVGSDSTVLQFSSMNWDASILELAPAIGAGARTFIAASESRFSGETLAEILLRERISFAALTPTVLASMPEVDLPDLQALTSGGEELPEDLARQLSRRHVFFNDYGPTETTVVCATHRCRPEMTGPPPIGRPLGSHHLYVVGPDGSPVLPGSAGELCIGGPALARGYVRQPGKTADRFRPSPFASEPGERLYLTGDLVFHRADGRLVYRGRIDSQVKIRGVRIELGEISSLLLEHPGVREAVAAVREAPSIGRYLAGYVVAAPGAAPSAAELREHLATRLPEHSVPAIYVFLDSLPVTVNGKIDHAALPEPDRARSEAGASGGAASTPWEELLAEMWGDLLGLERVDLDSSFFALGGHSLLATRLVSRIRRELGVDLPLRTVFEHPTVREMAPRVAHARLGAGGHRVPALVPVAPEERDGERPLSFAQQRLWVVDQLDPGNPAYNIPIALELEGVLDLPALAATFAAVVDRHEALRTRFQVAGDRPVQVIEPAAGLPVPVADLSRLPERRREAECRRLLAAEAGRPFDLGRAPLLRTLLLRLSSRRHAVAATFHHIVGDGWSVGVLVREVSALYQALAAGEPSPLPELPIQYADFAAWQRRWLSGPVLETEIDYWRRRLAGGLEPLELPGARNGAASGSGRAGRHRVALGPEASRGARRLARGEGATLFMVLFAALSVLLHRRTGRRDFVVGTEIANRNRPEVEGLVGFFVNLLALRAELGGDPTFRELLARARETALGAYAHQDLPFDRLVQEVAPDRAGAGAGFLQVMLVLENEPEAGLELPGLRVVSRSADEPTAKFDLLLVVTETPGALVGEWTFPAERFDPPAVAELSRQLETILEAVVRDPDVRVSRIDLQSSSERERSEMQSKERREARLQRFMSKKPETVKVSREKLVELSPSPAGGRLPLVIEPAGMTIDLGDWARSQRELIEEKVLDHGAILFRGFGLAGVEAFEELADTLASGLYGDYGDLPRQEVSGKVYTSTPYPPDKAILMHNESAQMHCWPMKQFFFCVTPSRTGGETPLVDCREVYRRLDPEVRRPFEDKGLLYVRNFTDELDVGWEEFFRTSDRSEVEGYCRQAGMEWAWTAEGLRTRKHAPAVARHPVTGETVFFNQLQAHHISCVDPEVRESLLSLFSVEDLPRNVYYGDGSPIEDEVVAHLVALYDELAVTFPWQRGDVVMVDNMLVGHGRLPFTGDRKIIVAMGQMVRSEDVEWSGKGLRDEIRARGPESIIGGRWSQ